MYKSKLTFTILKLQSFNPNIAENILTDPLDVYIFGYTWPSSFLHESHSISSSH